MVFGPTAPPVMIMLIACSIVRSVSVTRSMGIICKKAEVGLMAQGTSTAASNSPLASSVMVRVKKPMHLWPLMGKSTSTTRWLDSFLAVMLSMSWRTEV